MNQHARSGGFFCTLVLMGSSLALGSSAMAGCGGMTAEEEGSGGASAGAGGAATGGATAGGPSGGGATPPQTGGTDGMIVVEPPAETGGRTGSGGQLGFGGADPGECAPGQLVCPEQNLYTSCADPYTFLRLPSFCECDPTQPTSADDCDADEVFVCMGAAESATGRELETLVPYNCACVTGEPAGCRSVCSQHVPSADLVYCYDPGEVDHLLDTYLCGCALPLLR